MDETVPAIKKIAGKETVVIPILNIYGTGGRLQKKLPELTVSDGCIYVSANILEPGVILQHGKILRVVNPESLKEPAAPNPGFHNNNR